MRVKNSQISGSGASHVGLFGRQLMLRNKEDDKGGGGGDDKGDDETFEQKFNKLFHKASAERDARLEKKIMKGLDTTLSSKFDELKALMAKPDDEDDGDKGEEKKKSEGTPNKAQLDPEIKAQIARAESAAKEAAAKADKWEKTAKEEKLQRAKTEEINELTQMLTGHVKPALLPMVVGQLHGRVVRDEETNKILFKGEDGDPLPLKDGVDMWKKSDQGKEVAPPRNAGGSGGQGGGGGASRDPKNFGMDDLGDVVAGVLSGNRG